MQTPRAVPLYEPSAAAACWNEGMEPGEFAVHYSSFGAEAAQPHCTILSSLPAAEAYAAEAVRRDPARRCRIYGHEGFVGAPVRELRGAQYKGEGEITARFRRWGGSLLFFGGLALLLVDWSTGFRLSWPGLIGSRTMLPGLVLLATEALVMLHARQKASQAKDRSPA